MKKAIVFIMVSLLLVLSFAACGKADAPGQSSASEGQKQTSVESKVQEKADLNFWYTANDANPSDYFAKWLKENIQLFQDQNPNITIQPTVISDANQYLTKITTEIAAGNAPDIFMTWMSGRLEPFVTANRLHPLDDLIKNNAVMSEIIPEQATRLAEFNGQIYAIPTISTGEVIYYNKKIFSENNWSIPQTYEELLKIVEECKAKGIIPMAMGNDSVWLGSVPYMAYFQRMYGNELYEEVILNKTPKFDDPSFIEAGKELQRMVGLGMFTPNANAVKPEESQASFKEGRAAMSFDGTWRLPVFFDALQDDLGFFNFPDVAGGKGSKSVWLVNYGNAMSISSNSKYINAAEQFMAFMFTKERQKVLGEYGQLLACTNIDLDKTKISEIAYEMNEAMASTTYAYIPWDNPLGTNIGNEFNKATQGIIGGKNPEDMFKTLNEVAKQEWVK